MTRRTILRYVTLFLGLSVVAGSGCSDTSKPNPELKPPEIPPGGRDVKKGSQSKPKPV